MTKLSVIVPSWNTRDLLRSMLCSLEPALPPSCEVIVIDNGSTDGSAGMVAREFPHVRLVKNERNEGFAHAVNQGLERTRGEFVLVAQPDTELVSGSIRPMLQYLEENERYGAVAPRILNPDGSSQQAVCGLPSLWTPLAQAVERWDPEGPELKRRFALDFDDAEEADVEAAHAVCILLRRRALSRTEAFDETFRLYYADLDVCRRLRDFGWRIRYLPEVRVFHHGQRAIQQHSDPLSVWNRDRMTYYRKHHGRFAGQWVKTCSAIAFADQCLGELWRRANGEEDMPLGPVYEQLACCLRC